MIPINNVLFLDIETVPKELQFSELNERERKLFFKKMGAAKYALLSRTIESTIYLSDDGIKEAPNDILMELQRVWLDNAALYPEFAKIACISMGYIKGDEKRISSIVGDELPMLTEFDRQIRLFNSSFYLCAHNGNNFDYPFIIRRMIYNKIKLPPILQIAGLEPWKLKLVDTKNILRFNGVGDNHQLSLDVATCSMGIDSPKDELVGADVYKAYYSIGDYDNMSKDETNTIIKKYCEKDVIAMIEVYNQLSMYC